MAWGAGDGTARAVVEAGVRVVAFGALVLTASPAAAAAALPAQETRVGHRRAVLAEVLAGMPWHAKFDGHERVVGGIAYSGGRRLLRVVDHAWLAGGPIVGEVPAQNTLPWAPVPA